MSKQIGKQINLFLLSWLSAVTIEYSRLPAKQRALSGLDCLSSMSLPRTLLLTALLFILWNTITCRRRFNGLLRLGLVCVFAIYTLFALSSSFSWALLLVCLLVLGYLAVYALKGRNGESEQVIFSGKEILFFPLLSTVTAVLFILFVSGWTVARVRSFSTPTFDFGIFSQMFAQMKETGLPLTTLERDGLLSHFAVHVSPIYYLMLPVYYLIPRPETLQILQATVLASAVIPLWKLGKLHGLHPSFRLAVCVLLLLYPAYAGGCSYDLHENCFLTPLLLWLLYGMDKQSLSVTALSAALTLSIKEDAAVYVAVFGLYLLLRGLLSENPWERRAGFGLLICSVLWFLTVTAYLANNGDGVMNYRYSNFYYDGSNSLFTVIKAVFLCPMKAVYECVDPEKLGYIALTLFPLLGLPLMTRRYERFLLWIPYLLVNLMSDYQYQHSIWFQYSFGSAACLIYLAVVNTADIKPVWFRSVLLTAAISVSLFCFCQQILPTARYYVSKSIQYNDVNAAQRAVLDTIPEDASVASSTFYTTYLSNHSQLYDIRYGSEAHILSCAYIVAAYSEDSTYKKYRTEDMDGREAFISMIQENGYRLECSLDGIMEIYRNVP